MRISTSMIFQRGVNSLNSQQSSLLNLSEQIASGKKVSKPSDNPLAMSKAVSVIQSKMVNSQFDDARVSARNALSQEESVLNSVSTSVTAAKTLLIQASSDTLSDSDRASIASDLQGILNTLFGQANAADGNGKYMFGGYQDGSPPFIKDGAGNVSYVGDEGVFSQKVDSDRLMPTTDNGMDIFMSVYASAGFVGRADDSNTGTMTFEQPLSVDPNDPGYRGDVDIEFSDVAGATYYSVNGGAPQPYVKGEAITANGMSVVVKGDPNPGDKLAVRAGENGNSNLFKTLGDAISALTTTVSSDADKARVKNTLLSASAELVGNLDKVLTVRASVGSKLNELDIVDSVGDNRALNYKATLSDLVDLELNGAISEYSIRNTGLQAAQQAFVKIQGLSLFNFLK